MRIAVIGSGIAGMGAAWLLSKRHETVLFDIEYAEGGAAKTQGCVVRIKPASFTVFPDNLFDEQYQVMKKGLGWMHIKDYRHPKPP